jgi:hypothetical protein
MSVTIAVLALCCLKLTCKQCGTVSAYAVSYSVHAVQLSKNMMEWPSFAKFDQFVPTPIRCVLMYTIHSLLYGIVYRFVKIYLMYVLIG